MDNYLGGSRDVLLDASNGNPHHGDDSRGCSDCIKKTARDVCSKETLKKRIPIVGWLPSYNGTILLQDMIAGITVGLTAIPQSIAYAIVAGLPPQYGLYSALLGCFVYLIFGSCKDVTIGPTAILSVMVSKYVVGFSPDFAILATFLSGCVILLLGVLHLGFLLDFISGPVISGFTTAAALQIAATQLKPLFGLAGSAGYTFVEAVINFVKNVKTLKVWDPVLGFLTIIMLIVLKELGKFSSRSDIPSFSLSKNILWKFNWFTSLARNAVVVIVGIIIAYCVKIYLDLEPFELTGTIQGGLPKFQVPPFTTVVGNETYSFTDMMTTYGPQSIVLPLISILESIAIAKAFAKGKMVDATQEMIALGLCNIVSSFGQSMPVTGSFTRTALNYASGVQTPAGGIFKAVMVFLALGLMTKTFYYIPRATLAGLIITAMFSMIDYVIILQLWRNKKSELFVLLVTMVACLYQGLEYGIIIGTLIDACLLLFRNSRPSISVEPIKVGPKDAVLIVPFGAVSYCAADYLSSTIKSAANPTIYGSGGSLLIIVDGQYVKDMSSTVMKNLVAVINDLEKNSHRIVFWNFSPTIEKMCQELTPNSVGKFVNAPNILEYELDSTEVVEGVRTG